MSMMTETATYRPRVRLNNLQIARAMAATLVILFHASEDVAKVRNTTGGLATDFFRFGNAGVDLFFVISGFIIMYAHRADIGRPDRLPHYAYRRVTRIYPLFWVLCFFILPLYFVYPSAGQGWQREWDSLLGTILLLPVPPKPIIGVAWTLVIEVLFYGMFALLIAGKKIGRMAFVVWLAAASLSVFFGPPQNFLLSKIFSPYFFDFALGVTIALLFQNESLKNLDRFFLAAGCLIFVTTGAIMVMTGASEINPTLPYRLGFGFGSAGIVMGMVLRDRAEKPAAAILLLVGNATYSIYLFHWLIQGGLTKLWQKLGIGAGIPSLPLLLLYAVPEIGLCYLVYILLERPLLSASGRFAQRRAQMAAGS